MQDTRSLQPRKLNQSHDCNCTVTFYLFFISLACAFFFSRNARCICARLQCNSDNSFRSMKRVTRKRSFTNCFTYTRAYHYIFTRSDPKQNDLRLFEMIEHAYASSIPFTSDFFHKFAWAIVIKVRARESESEREREREKGNACVICLPGK